MQIRLRAKIYMDAKEFEGDLIFNTPYPSQESASLHVQWRPLKDMPYATMGISVDQSELWQVLKQFKGARKEKFRWQETKRKGLY